MSKQRRSARTGTSKQNQSAGSVLQHSLPFDVLALPSTPEASDSQPTLPSDPAAPETVEPIDSYDRRISASTSPTTSGDAALPRKISVQGWHDLRLLLHGIRDAAKPSESRERREE